MQIHTSIARTVLVIMAGIATSAAADELTMMIEQDLARLGYETGPVDGEETIETAIAISKFQAENNVAVTGKVSSELARMLMAAQPAGALSAPAPVMDPAALQAAQNACLQEKAAASQAAQKTKRGLSRLFKAVTRTASREGNYELARTADDIYYAGATADDLSAAAKDLGLTEDDVAACRNPSK